MLKDGEKGAVRQKDGSYAIVPHFPMGVVSPSDLRNIADIAEKYEVQAVKITSASRIALVGIKEENIDAVWADLNPGVGHAVGLCVRSIQVCPGTTFCRLGKQDTLAIGSELDKRFHGLSLPNKCKIGVSGCLNNCAETPIKDLGFVGKKDGWTVFAGGNAASRPQLAREVCSGLTDEQALELADKALHYFKAGSKKTERMGRFIDRVGLDTFKSEVCPKS
jgi:NAD(P)H-nitrite reductase large subunit